MRILLVTPYPPGRDGLASYAAQVAAQYRGEGHDVQVLSPEPSAGRYHADLKSIAGARELIRLGRQADLVVIQFHPEIFFAGSQLVRFVGGWLRLMLSLRLAGNVDVVVHEAPYQARGRSAALRLFLWKLLWHQPRQVLVHTEWERSQMRSAMGVPDSRIELLDHGASFRRQTELSREGARESLGLSEDAFVFLSAGFVQPHKGFDRAARAMQRLRGANVELHIVGDLRVSTPDHHRYLELLRAQAASDPRVVFHERYVSDEEFDRWLVAADAVVLPYREIWSSGVVERALLFDRPLIVTPVGGLLDQVRPSDSVVHDEDDLVAAMAKLSGAEIAPDPSPALSSTTAEDLRALVRERAERLRAWWDPLESADRPVLDVPAAEVRLETLALPLPPSGHGPRAAALRVVRRLTRWQLDPIVRYVNALRAAALGLDGDPDDRPGSKPGVDGPGLP